MRVSDLPSLESRIAELAAQLGYDDVQSAEDDDAEDFAPHEESREP